MGYSTAFKGRINIEPQLSLDDYQTLIDYNQKDWRDDNTRPNDDSYYCQWMPTRDGRHLEWDGGEKFYEHIDWMEWLIDEFFKPKGYILNGEIIWEGEEAGDVGKIVVKDNELAVKVGRIVYD